MLRRRSNLSCYFCNSSVPLPKDPAHFRCPHCNCLNRWVNGHIVSDEPAMHDEKLNSRAFSKRATQRNDRIPSMYGRPGVFCHTCQTNQMLIVNLLANYLDSDDADQGTQTLDGYRESLHLRYPPVCDSCQPAVEEEIRRKDAMARSHALGGYLNQTKGKARQRQVSLTREETQKLGTEMLIWRIRGCLWAATVAASILGSASAALGYRPFSWLSVLLPALPLFATISIFWAVWDPTYSSFRSARIQGRDVRVRGKTRYIKLQMVTWATRLTTSIILATYRLNRADPLHLSLFPSYPSRIYFSAALVIELGAALISYFTLQLQQPPTIRLIDTAKHMPDLSRSRSQTPIPSAPQNSSPEPENLFAGLTFSSKPMTSPEKAAPVFGLPSMLSALTTSTEPVGDDSMDVDMPPNAPKAKTGESSAVWLRPQRFFAPEAPTGLEGLFERTKIIDDITMSDATSSLASRSPSGRSQWLNWGWVYAAAFLTLLVGVTWKVWSMSMSLSTASSQEPLPTPSLWPLDPDYMPR
ncbi:integral inner nuclear membrane protein ima1 [Favolaschia claudopus]|uniref:Integral inner nuclear membrane protein ima1 n=1 Tax=Favolaschia claudopus TaxID=2862362 RepID=A0AAW0EG16_9AGAR